MFQHGLQKRFSHLALDYDGRLQGHSFSQIRLDNVQWPSFISSTVDTFQPANIHPDYVVSARIGKHTLPTIAPLDPDWWKQKCCTYIWWIDIDGNPLVEDQNDQVTKDAEQEQHLRKRRNNLLTQMYQQDKKEFIQCK